MSSISFKNGAAWLPLQDATAVRIRNATDTGWIDKSAERGELGFRNNENTAWLRLSDGGGGYVPPNPYTLTLARNDLDFIYASDVPNTGATTLRLEFVISFDDFFTAGGDHIPFGINMQITDPHTNHCGPITRNGQNLFSYGRGFLIAAGTDNIIAEHWNGTPSPGLQPIARASGSGFNPAVNTQVRVRVVAGMRTGPWANAMLIYIYDMGGVLLFNGTVGWGWDPEATYKAAIGGIALGFTSPNSTGCVETSAAGSAPNASATITNISHTLY